MFFLFLSRTHFEKKHHFKKSSVCSYQTTFNILLDPNLPINYALLGDGKNRFKQLPLHKTGFHFAFIQFCGISDRFIPFKIYYWACLIRDCYRLLSVL